MVQNVAYVSAGRRIFDNNLILVLDMALPTMSLAEVRALSLNSSIVFRPKKRSLNRHFLRQAMSSADLLKRS